MQALTRPLEIKAQPRIPQPLKIVALGDSLVYGFGDPEGGGWVERLRRQWMADEHQAHVLYNLGIRGDRTFQVKNRLLEEFRNRGELRNRVPDLIMLSVGINDSPRLGRADGSCFTHFETFGQQMENLLEQAQALCPVLFVGMIPVDEAKMPFLDCLYFNHDDQFRYKEATKLACAERQIPYLDLFDIWMERGTHWRQMHTNSDGLHPNSRGYRSIWYEVINWHPINQLSQGKLLGE